MTLAIPASLELSDDPRLDVSGIGEEVFIRRNESRLLLSLMPDAAEIRFAPGEPDPPKVRGALVAAFIASSREILTENQPLQPGLPYLSFEQTSPRIVRLRLEQCKGHAGRTLGYSSLVQPLD